MLQQPNPIAVRAAAHVGAPFRFKGRSAAGFDCVGLVADAIGMRDVPLHYTLRGDFRELIERALMDSGFIAVSDGPIPGDILVVRTAPQQLHLMIATNGGFVHAHAGLRRVVLTPAPSPWPIIGHWRFIGD